MDRRPEDQQRSDRSLRDRIIAAADPDEVASDPELSVVADLAVADANPPRARNAGIRPSAARRAARARRTWLSMLFIPVFAIYLLLDAMRELRAHLTRANETERERRPSFHRPEAMPGPDERSMEDIVSALESFPFHPSRLPASAVFFRDNGADATGALFSANPQMASFPHFYPSTFQEVLFEGCEGERIAGMRATHEHSGPAVVICHGLLMNKHFDVIISLAKRAYEEWGFHVVTLDLRGWGDSAWTTDAPASAGYYEGRDLLEVCRTLHEDPLVTSVGAIGYSLGGATVLNAAHASSLSDDKPLDGGGIAISAPTDIDPVLTHISTKPHWRDPYFGLWNLFRAAIKSNVRRRGLLGDPQTWRDLVETTSPAYYGVSMEEYCRRASAVNFAHEITQPVLELHSTDDFLVPVWNAYQLQDAVADNPWVHVMVRDGGAHCAFAAADSAWFHSTVRRWLEYWATPGAFKVDPAEDEILG